MFPFFDRSKSSRTRPADSSRPGLQRVGGRARPAASTGLDLERLEERALPSANTGVLSAVTDSFGHNVVYKLSGNDVWWNPSNTFGDWQNLSNCGCISHISAGTDGAGNADVWINTFGGNVWENFTESGGGWFEVWSGGGATQVSAGYSTDNGYFTMGNDVWYWNGSASNLSNCGCVANISAGLEDPGVNVVWVTTGGGNVWENFTQSSGTWFERWSGGGASQVSAGINNGGYFLVGGDVWWGDNFGTNSNLSNCGCVDFIDAGTDSTGGNAVYVHATNDIWENFTQSGGNWSNLSNCGCVADLAGAGFDNAYVETPGSAIWWHDSSFSWHELQ